MTIAVILYLKIFLSTIVRGTTINIFTDCMMDIKSVFGKKVKEFRTTQKISQESLADLAGLDRTYISDIEKGKRNVSIETIQKISIALKIEMKDFFEINHHDTSSI